MDFNNLLTQVINEEFAKIEQDGTKIKLRSVRKERIRGALITGVIAFFTLITVYIPIICIIVFFSKYLKPNRTAVIARLAKSMPNKDIALIIREDMI